MVSDGNETKTANCTDLTINDNKLLTVSKNIAAGGTITGSGISCGGDCSQLYANNTPVTLTAAFAAGYVFSNWSNCSTSTSSSLLLTMNADKTCVANFTPINALPVAVAGISLNTTSFDSIINIKRGASTTFYLSAWRGTQVAPSSKSDDPDVWTNASLGMSSGGAKCEFANDLIEDSSFFVPGPSRAIPPSFSECSDPDADASALNYLMLTKTFDASYAAGDHTYYILRLTDRAGGVSNIGTAQIHIRHNTQKSWLVLPLFPLWYMARSANF